MRIKSIEVHSNPVLGDLTLDFTENNKAVDTILLVGENGCGKSTILNLIYELSLCDLIIRTDSRETRTYELELSQADMVYFENHLPPGIVEQFQNHTVQNEISVSYDLQYQQDWKQVKVYLYSLDGSNQEYVMPQLHSVRKCFKSIFSDTEINFATPPISNVTSKTLDLESITSEKAAANLATEITQLLVDIQALDDADYATSRRSNASNEPDDSLFDARIGRFNKAYSYMFPAKKYKRIDTSNGSKRVMFEENDQEIYIGDLSSGEKQIVFRGGFLLKNQGSSAGNLVLIDEPEISLHPRWQLKILDFYKMLCTNAEGVQKSQLFVATHSPFILHNDRRSNDKVLVLERDSTGKISVNDNGGFFGWEPEKTIAKAFHLDLNFAPQKTTIITEGKTDWMHLKYALAQLKLAGTHSALDIDFLEYNYDMGDTNLKHMCEYFSRVTQARKMIFVFDRDNLDILKNVQGTEGYKSWGNNVYSFAIPVPNHREGTPDISIEFYYTDNEMNTIDSQGRRLYISTEFNIHSCKHKTDPSLNCTDRKARLDRLSIIDNGVFDENSRNIALTKNDFAEHIVNQTPPFDQFKVQHFSIIFDVISKIVALS